MFSFNEGGFVLVSANDAVTPVLGYGFDYPIPDSITNEAVIGWFDGYARQIDTAFVIKLDNAAASEKWNQILKNTFPKSPGDGVGPLLTTIWDQGCYYNDSCPEGLGGPCNHAWTGCVATAMAQIMKYHDFPQQGYGENAYVSNNYGTISVNFFNSYYNWNAMTDMATSSNPEIAKLMFDCGVSLNMDYSPYSSGAYT
ncbi:MAG: C10 family peptidase, partial [Bacteroidota bacterium]